MAAVVALVVTIEKLSTYLWREHKASMKAINDALIVENTRLRLDLRTTEERRDFYRRLAHDQASQIMGLADQLSVALLELDRARHLPELLPGDQPKREA